ncbi:hypothetical protein [Phenylobacterium sp.]|uniref:hypothetical protein n=1 Tax=Phenylobacterium sp. TaxID=1871053 RepID=UPI003962DB67
MVRGWLAAGGIVLALMATPAAACRLGGDVLIFEAAAPETPPGERFATVARVRLEGERPDLKANLADLADPRGFPVGTARVLEVVRGPAPPPELPAYIAALTSCSDPFVGPPGPFVVTGYVVGQVMRDARGPYLLLAERNDVTGRWK